MLPFMREQNRDPSPGTRRSTDTGNEIPVTSDGALRRTPNSEITKDEKYLTVAARNKNVRKTTYLLAVLTGCGLLCLWFMIKKSVPLSAVADNKGGTESEQIETTIAQLTGVRSEMSNQMDEVVKKFYQFSDVQQVNVDELVKNPFEPAGAVHEPLLFSSLGEDQELGHGMQLLGIMRSDQGSCCMLRVPILQKDGKMGYFDDKILYEGDSIGDFKVRQINDSFVKLESGHRTPDSSQEIILKVPE